MSQLQYEFMLGLRMSQIQERLNRKPFLKIVEETKNYPVPLIYDPRTEDEVMNHIKLRMRMKLNKKTYGKR